MFLQSELIAFLNKLRQFTALKMPFFLDFAPLERLCRLFELLARRFLPLVKPGAFLLELVYLGLALGVQISVFREPLPCDD